MTTSTTYCPPVPPDVMAFFHHAETLSRSANMARSHFEAWQELTTYDSTLLSRLVEYPYFDLARDGHFMSFLGYFATLYERRSDSVTLKTLLTEWYKPGDSSLRDQLLDEHEALRRDVQPLLDLRHKAVAHMDKEGPFNAFPINTEELLVRSVEFIVRCCEEAGYIGNMSRRNPGEGRLETREVLNGLIPRPRDEDDEIERSPRTLYPKPSS